MIIYFIVSGIIAFGIRPKTEVSFAVAIIGSCLVITILTAFGSASFNDVEDSLLSGALVSVLTYLVLRLCCWERFRKKRLNTN